jgi:RNA recognition motif-containing protein
MNLFVSELDIQTRRIDLKSLFEQYGKVGSAKMSFTKGAERGLSIHFVETQRKKEGMKCIDRLRGKVATERYLAAGMASVQLCSGFETRSGVFV